jgi:hypothetical protein
LDWKTQAIKRNTPKEFKCSECGEVEEALPVGMEDVKGGTHFVYHLPEGWWHITVREGMKMFCKDEAVTIAGGEIL